MCIYIYIYIYIYLLHITCSIVPIECLLIDLDAHMFSPHGYGPGTNAQGPKAESPKAPWARAHIHYV